MTLAPHFQPIEQAIAGMDPDVRSRMIEAGCIDDGDHYNIYYDSFSDSRCSLARDARPRFCNELATGSTETHFVHTEPRLPRGLPSGRTVERQPSQKDENYYWVTACSGNVCSDIDSESPAAREATESSESTASPEPTATPESTTTPKPTATQGPRSEHGQTSLLTAIWSGVDAVQCVIDGGADVNARDEAGRVLVGLDFGEDELRLSVSDDGVGLPGDYEGRGHGFANMRAYAERLGGCLIVEPRGPEGGASVTCVTQLARVRREV